MGNAYIETNTVNLKSDVEKLNTQVQEAKKCMQGIIEDIKILKGGWQGAAEAAFEQQIVSDMEFLSEVIEEAAELASCMGYAAKEYIKCENDVSDAVALVRI